MTTLALALALATAGTPWVSEGRYPLISATHAVFYWQTEHKTVELHRVRCETLQGHSVAVFVIRNGAVTAEGITDSEAAAQLQQETVSYAGSLPVEEFAQAACQLKPRPQRAPLTARDT